MSLAQGSDENGTPTHAYTVTNSQLTYFDYLVNPGLSIGHFTSLVYLLRRDHIIA